MATRGQLGGLARATADAALVLDASGKDVVVIETVGVGQDEVDIVRTADVSIVTLVPGAGDEVQAHKAGIMEIADIFVVNKADREGSDHVVSAIEASLSLFTLSTRRVAAADREDRGDERAGCAGARAGDCGIPGVRRTGRQPGGCEQAGGRRRMRGEQRLRDILSQHFMRHLEREVSPDELARVVDAIAARELDPYTAADSLLKRTGLKTDPHKKV